MMNAGTCLQSYFGDMDCLIPGSHAGNSKQPEQLQAEITRDLPQLAVVNVGM